MEQKQNINLCFEAGDYLRQEAQELVEDLSGLLKTATPEDWAIAAAHTVGSGELNWPTRLIERLKACESHRPIADSRNRRVEDYVRDRRLKPSK